MRTIYVGDTVYQKTETGFISYDVAEVIDQTTIKAIVLGEEKRVSDFLTLSEVYRIHGEDAFVAGKFEEVEHTVTQDDLDANAPDLADAGVEVGDVVTFTADESREIDEANNPAETEFMQENAPEAIENETVPEITVSEQAFEETASATTDEEVKPVEDLTDLTKFIESTVAAPAEETLPAAPVTPKKASTRKKK